VTEITVERIQAAKAQIEERRAQTQRADAREEQLLTDLETFKQDLRDEGIDPATLDEQIEQTAAQLDTELTKLEKALGGNEETSTGT